MATLPPLVDDLSAWVGQSIEAADARAEAVLSAATALVRGYAGLAWDDDTVPDDVHAVVVQVAARVWHNPTGAVSWTKGPFSERYADDVANGLYLTESERIILNRYRTTVTGLWVQPTTHGAVETPLDDYFITDLAAGDASGTYVPEA